MVPTAEWGVSRRPDLRLRPALCSLSRSRCIILPWRSLLFCPVAPCYNVFMCYMSHERGRSLRFELGLYYHYCIYHACNAFGAHGTCAWVYPYCFTTGYSIVYYYAASVNILKRMTGTTCVADKRKTWRGFVYRGLEEGSGGTERNKPEKGTSFVSPATATF